LQLHCEGDIELDPTYSTGGFYKQGVKEPLYKFDICPVRPGVIQANAEHLPIKDESISTMILDFPFLATKGPSLLNKKEGQNETIKRFGCYPTEKELFALFKNSLKEAYRVLKKNGICIFKIQDKISSSKQYMSHVYAINYAERFGFYIKDLFILLAKNRLTPEWQIKNQVHGRKYHSYFIVFQKKLVNLGIEKI
jgi:tRNA G10  N-methylase Trm11